MPESVISIRRNRSSVYNLAINDPITVTLRREGGRFSVPTVATFSFLFVPKVFPTSYNHFSRNVPPVSNPSPPTRSSSPCLPLPSRVGVGEPSLPRQPSTPIPVQPLISEKFFSRFLPRVGTQPFPSPPLNAEQVRWRRRILILPQPLKKSRMIFFSHGFSPTFVHQRILVVAFAG